MSDHIVECLFVIGIVAAAVMIIPKGKNEVQKSEPMAAPDFALAYDGLPLMRVAPGHDVKILDHATYQLFFFDKKSIEQITGTVWKDVIAEDSPQVWFVHPADGRTYRAVTPVVGRGTMACWGLKTRT